MTTHPEVDLELAREHGLSEGEWNQILELLGRVPTYPELGIFSVMWSEHCSYKSSKKYLKQLPTEGPQVVVGPGENAGVVALGHDRVAVFKMESHNHPSYVEPHAGAATGVGGIMRDIFTMGARPIANLNSLRFGPLDEAHQRYLMRGVVAGIADYGNCFGCATVGGEVSFHPRYRNNILVNAMNVGIAPAGEIFLAKATGVGNPVIYVGSKTGRDGIHGATMASKEFDEDSQAKRPTVQVGDPFTEKLLLEACLEAMRSGAIVGIQDMGAAGLTCSAFEMASSGGTGIEMWLERVPQREEGLTPYELLLSESQERMLMVAEAGREGDLEAIFRKWDLDFAVVGRVTDDGFMRIGWKGETVVSIPVDPVAASSPELSRPYAAPADLEARRRLDASELKPVPDASEALLRLLASPNVCSRAWVYRQYDQLVQASTVIRPGGDAAVLRVPETPLGIAVSADCNPRYCALDPYLGTQHAVAESARNVAVTGANPLAITNCLNFGSPERLEGMWELVEAIRGMGDACRLLETPVVSGNVSLYNETEGEGSIPPTPTIGMLGLMQDVSCAIRSGFRAAGHAVVLLGEGAPALGGSEYLSWIHEREGGALPPLDLPAERRLCSLLVAAAAERLLESAHDASIGGLAVALAECAFERDIGCDVALPLDAEREDVVLFGERAGTVVVSCRPEKLDDVLALAKQWSVPAKQIGVTQPARIRIQPGIDISTREAHDVWNRTLPEALDDVARA